MDRNQVVLVNEIDETIGVMDKMEAHRTGSLHRAFSIFIFNDKNEMLLHQRARDKYHGANLWTNACCSHPQLYEDVQRSAAERLNFEMGMQCELEAAFTFIYKAAVENGLIEHELDHVFIGYSNLNPNPNPAEVQDYKWIDLPNLVVDIQQFPHKYSIWFRTCVQDVIAHYTSV